MHTCFCHRQIPPAHRCTRCGFVAEEIERAVEDTVTTIRTVTKRGSKLVEQSAKPEVETR